MSATAPTVRTAPTKPLHRATARLTLDDMSTNDTAPVIIAVPCFAGAPWDERQLRPFAGWTVVTRRLPEGLGRVEAYADVLAAQVREYARFVLAGDSYGAAIALELATRRPAGLVGLALSGGFASNPLPIWKAAAARLSRFSFGPLWPHATLRFHASQLASPYDRTAPEPHAPNDFRRFFLSHTNRETYAARVLSVVNFDVRSRLHEIDVPTLVLSPSYDHLVGRRLTDELVAGIPDVREIVLERTGHMFRFTHPDQHGAAIVAFVEREVLGRTRRRPAGP